MSELTNIHARAVKDLTTPTELPVDTDALDQVKLVAGNFPAEYVGNEAMTVGMIKDLAAQGREEELEAVNLKIANEEIRAKEVEASLIKNKANKANTLEGYGITDTYTKSQIDSKVVALETRKANKADVDIAISNLSTTANKYYSTLAAANADIANIALNQSVTIGEEANSGLWEKKTARATTLTKSTYDPLRQSKKYIDGKISGQNILKQAQITTDFFINILPNENRIQESGGFTNVSTFIIECKPDTEYMIKNFTENPSAFSIHEHSQYTTVLGTVLTPSTYYRVDSDTHKLKTGINTHYLYINKTFDGFVNNISEIYEELVSLDGIPLITERSLLTEQTDELGYGENIYNESQIVTGKVVVTSSGTIMDFQAYRLAVVPVESGSLLNIYCDNYLPSGFAFGFRSTNDLSTGGTFGSGNSSSITLKGDDSFDVVVPHGMNYLFINVNYFGDPPVWDIRTTLRVSKYTTGKFYVSEINKLPLLDKKARELIKNLESKLPLRLSEKRWLAIGDSLTDYTFRPYSAYKNYAEQLSGKFNMSVYNYGQSGSGFYGRYNSLNQITQPETDVDFITVFLGTNDWGNIGNNNKPLGVFGDATASTISGCVNLFIQDLNNRFPNTPIFFFTPLPRFDAWGENSVNNSQGYKLNELVEMIKRYAHHYSLPVLDLYNESNFKCQTTVQKDTWTVRGDGVHPTHLAHERLLPIIEGFLTKNL